MDFPAHRSSKCRNCKQMTGLFMGWHTTSTFSLSAPSALTFTPGEMVPPLFWKGTVSSKLYSFLTAQSNGFLLPRPIFLTSLPLAPANKPSHTFVLLNGIMAEDSVVTLFSLYISSGCWRPDPFALAFLYICVFWI